MEVCDQLHAPATLPPGEKTVPIEYEAGFAPEPARSFWRKEKSFALRGIRTLDRTFPTVSPIPGTLSWPLFSIYDIQFYTGPSSAKRNSVLNQYTHTVKKQHQYKNFLHPALLH
jgi:hypothetical protein